MEQLPIEIKYTYLIAIAILFLFVCFIVALVFIYNKRQVYFLIEKKLSLATYQNSLLEKDLEKSKALLAERKRISADLHDDLGSTISSFALMLHLAKEKVKTPESQEDMNQLYEQAMRINENIKDIVWASNTENDTLEMLLIHMRQYTVIQCEKLHLEFEIDMPKHIPECTIDGVKRKDILLTVKETLNNIFKHACASNIHVSFLTKNDELNISIIDNGIGLPENIKYGNGLLQMKNRMIKQQGIYEITNNATCGTTTTLRIPILYT
ncbi:MAG: histidine kinase [Chitinophagaceae bacterium]